MNKTFLLTSALAASLAASAASANLADILHKPAAGERISVTSYEQTDKDSTAGTTKNTNETTSIRQEITMGYSDELTLGLAVAYKENETKSGTAQAISADGIADPELIANYRFATEANDGYAGDVNVNFTPEIMDAEVGEAVSSTEVGADGEVGNGGHKASISASYGRTMDNITYRVSAGADWSDDAEAKDHTDGTAKRNIKYDSKTDYRIGVDGQYRVNDQISIDAGYEMVIADDADYTGVGATAKTKVSGGDNNIISLGVNYNIDPNKIVVSLGMTRDDIDNSKSTATSGTVTTTNYDTNTNYTVSLKYRF
jgi:hypothetical protein